MEDKLKKLRSAMDESVFKNGEFSSEAKSEVYRKIEKQQQPSSRLVPWMKPAFSTAVCLILLLASLYAFNHKSILGSFPYPHLLPKQQGKLTLLYVGKNSQEQDNYYKALQRYILRKKQISLETAKQNFSKLHINHAPNYIFFNSKGVAFRSGDPEKAGKFLINYVKKKTGFPYPLLLSPQKGKYHLMMIVSGLGNSVKQPKITHDKKAFKLLYSYSVDPIKRDSNEYPQLHIPNQRPYFIFFDTQGVVYKTDSDKLAELFLHSKLQSVNSSK